MFNDRKMAVRMEQRAMESAIQELHYKITVALNSDSKSEVEGLRWVLTRRAALAIAVMAGMFLSPPPSFFVLNRSGLGRLWHVRCPPCRGTEWLIFETGGI